MLAAGLNLARPRSVLGRDGRVHIPGFLDPEAARRLHESLATGTPWHRSLTAGGKSYDIALETLAELPVDRQAGMAQAMAAEARSGFQYQFDAWRLSDEVEVGRSQPGTLPLEDLYRWLNGEAFLGLVRELTGDVACAYVDAQATRYRAGDFLTAHDDDVADKHRLYAYVLNLTADWRPDYGGLLVFHDAAGHLSGGYSPSFNALNLFSVPQAHAVTQVASFVTAERLSVTGWIRSWR